MTKPAASADSAPANGASRWTVAICALIGLGLGLVIFAFRTPMYEAEAIIAVSNPVGPLADEIAVVTSPIIINAAASALGFTPDVDVTATQVAGLLTVTGRSDDPQRAAAAANFVAETYVQAERGAAANVAQNAAVPDEPSGLGAPVFAAIGTALGALAGAVISYLQSLRKPDDSPSPLRPIEQHRVPPAIPVPPSVRATDARPIPAIPEPPSPKPPRAKQAIPDAVNPEPSIPQAAIVDAAIPDPATPDPAIPDPAMPDPAIPQAAIVDAAIPDPARPQPSIPQPPSPKPAIVDAAIPKPPSPQPFIPDLARPSLPVPPMKTEPSSFADAANPATGGSQPSWLNDPAERGELSELDALGRRALQMQLDTARYELVLAHDEELAKQAAEHERQTVELRADVANLNKQVRMQTVRLKNRAGGDQTRVGDLEAQVDALELELADLRKSLEGERIAHAKRLTDERGSADRALDNARRRYREELAKHGHSNRQTLAEHRAELDHELASDRVSHESALEAQHQEYEQQLEADRERATATLAAANERHERELAGLRDTTKHTLDRQASQHKTTIASLRGAREKSESHLRDLEKENRLLRVEITSLQKQARHNETDNDAQVRRLSDEVALMKTELDGERQRNAALRADVLRRSAESHQAVDRAVEERTAQLAELEASVTRQREYADTRVREMSAAAEEQARQAATREASLTAMVSRLKREVEDLKNAASRVTP